MNKKGFTLIELLGVIVIIALLVLISVPIVNNIVNKSKKQIKNSNIITILDAAYAYSLDEEIDLAMPANVGDSITVTLDEVKKSGHLKKNITNAETNEPYDDSCIITITKKSYDKDEADAIAEDANKKFYNDYLFAFGC